MEEIDVKMVKYYAREISMIIDHTESIQESNESRHIKEQAKIQAYEEILSLIRSEDDD